jgi:hypothetical protein
MFSAWIELLMGSAWFEMVGASGFEPETSCAQSSKSDFEEMAYYQLLVVQWVGVNPVGIC